MHLTGNLEPHVICDFYVIQVALPLNYSILAIIKLSIY